MYVGATTVHLWGIGKVSGVSLDRRPIRWSFTFKWHLSVVVPICIGLSLLEKPTVFGCRLVLMCIQNSSVDFVCV